MKFSWCTITVRDMEESLKFYEEVVGLSVSKRFKAGPIVEIVFLGEGETLVELIFDPNHQAVAGSEGISLGFEVESLDKMISKLKEKDIKIVSGPMQPNPHIKFLFVKDPNGVNIQLLEQIK